MRKRKRSDDDSVFGETDSSDTVLNSDAVSANSCGTNKDEYDIWLIRKPTKVPLSDLSSIKFPHKAKNRVRLAIPSRSYLHPILTI
uniref:Uncharacterized protein n=1 Tax=Onchocerca volvulus TaxID=6282 RepID=A0A8R1TRY1_ONCVO